MYHKLGMFYVCHVLSIFKLYFKKDQKNKINDSALEELFSIFAEIINKWLVIVLLLLFVECMRYIATICSKNPQH